MYYEVCFIREDLPVGLARDIFLDLTGSPLSGDSRLSGYLTYSRAIDLQDSGQVKAYMEKARVALELPDCTIGSIISESVDSAIAKRNLKVGLVYYASVRFHDSLGGAGWCAVKPCNENKGKDSGLKMLR